MHLNGTYEFTGNKEAVYNLMQSQDALMHCLPGCESMERIGEDQYHAILKIGIAGIKGTYQCTITTTDKVPNESWTLTVEGQSKTGNVKGVAHFTMQEKDAATELAYDGEADLMGPLAGVGQRVIAPASRMIIGRFFSCMSEQLANATNPS